MSKIKKSNIVQGLHFQTSEAVRIYMEHGIIKQIEHIDLAMEGQAEPLPWVGPGLVDLQINGFAGIDFNTFPIRVEDVHRITRKLWQEGVTTFYPTVITNGDEQIERMVQSISQACSADRLTADSIPGIHLEGPFLSRQDGPRGAHGKQFIKAPDWELFQRWQRAANGLIKIVTLSPEYEQAPEFIEKCVQSGVVVSIGHTASDSEQIRRAVQAGATMSTHLGNGAHPMMPRHPNYIWDQLAEDRLWPSIIADGNHLPDSVLKVFLKVKAGQIMLVSDAVYLCGMPPGEYVTHIGGRVVLTEAGRLYLADNPELLAGSVQMLRSGVEHLAAAGICLPQTGWEMASLRPASFMNLPEGAGLSPGAPADLVLFAWEQSKLAILEVYKSGRCVAHANASASFSHC